jgi:predicted NBD/HSP70 family sugar kinase/fructoselysine-6-P-deglycase FrlB-like protein
MVMDRPMSANAHSNAPTIVADVGATFVRVALSRGAALGPIKERRVTELPCDEDDGIAPGIVGLMHEAIAAGFGAEATPVVAAGIGVCSAVDEGGSLQPPLSFGVPGDRRLVEIVSAALGVPVAIDNDANMAALGELCHGAGRGFSDFVLVTLGTNIGMGIVSGGRVLRGAHGGAGEGGLMLLPAPSLDQPDDESGRRLVDGGRFGAHPSRAPEGYAWIEELVGGGALASALSERRKAATGEAPQPDAPLRVLAEAAGGDLDAASIVDRAIDGWAYVIANCGALFDPAAIILAGGLAKDIDPFLERLRRRAEALSRAKPLVLKAELGSIGGLIGASAAALATLRTTNGERAVPEVHEYEATACATTAVRADPSQSLTTGAPRAPPYSDEMGREIGETPEAVRRTLEILRLDGRGFIEDLSRSSSVMLVGTGASLAMARCAEAMWPSSDASSGSPRRAVALEASEALFAESRVLTDPDAIVVVVSKSGQSPESLSIAEAARRYGNRVIAITSDAGSPLAGAASDVVLTPIGEEYGAATKSETAALAALLALGGLIAIDSRAIDRLVALLCDTVTDERCITAGSLAGTARRIWTVGFGPSRGVAEALGLLLHEKARLPAVGASPSGFRHGLVEASSAADSLIVFECRNEDPPLSQYFDLLAIEGQRVGLKIAWLAQRDRVGLNIRLRGSSEAERVLEAVVRAQQLAHAAAHAAGTYGDGFRVLRTIVDPGRSFA